MKTGNYRRTRLFVWTLGFSRKCIRLLTFQTSTQTWAERPNTSCSTVIDEAVRRICDGSITDMIYDATTARLVEK